MTYLGQNLWRHDTGRFGWFGRRGLAVGSGWCSTRGWHGGGEYSRRGVGTGKLDALAAADAGGRRRHHSDSGHAHGVLRAAVQSVDSTLSVTSRIDLWKITKWLGIWSQKCRKWHQSVNLFRIVGKRNISMKFVEIIEKKCLQFWHRCPWLLPAALGTGVRCFLHHPILTGHVTRAWWDSSPRCSLHQWLKWLAEQL